MPSFSIWLLSSSIWSTPCMRASQAGLSNILPQYVYLEVAQSPYVFLAGFAAVSVAALIDFNSEVPTREERAARTEQAPSGGRFHLARPRLHRCLVCGEFQHHYRALQPARRQVSSRLPRAVGTLQLPGYSPLSGCRGQSQTCLVIALLIASPAALYELGKRSSNRGPRRRPHSVAPGCAAARSEQGRIDSVTWEIRDAGSGSARPPPSPPLVAGPHLLEP